MTKITSKQIKGLFLTSELFVASSVFVLCLLLIATITILFDPSSAVGLYQDPDFWKNILVEAHGMLLDILVIGIFIMWLNKRVAKRLENQLQSQRYKEEIDDYRDWKSEEATYRITGIIKRLNKMGIHCLNLNECFLKNANLKEADLSNSTFYGVDLGGACLKGATLKNTKLRGAYMGDADFRGADLTGAFLRKARCQRALFQGAKFNGANLLRAEFFDANLQNADFRGSDLKEVKFRGANIRSANFLGATNITVTQLIEANSLKSAVLEQDILDEIRMVRPDLL